MSESATTDIVQMCLRFGKENHGEERPIVIMGKKFFVWSFDDGLEQDKKIVEILRSFGMGATFNLNSGLYGKRQMIGRIGNIGFREVSLPDFHKKQKHLLKYVPHYRIPDDEVREVYEGFEIASHSLGHENLTRLTEAELQYNITSDVENLSKKFGQKVTGFAYPFGAKNSTTKKVLMQCGITYARTVKMTNSFDFPADPMELNLTGGHTTADALSKVDQFIAMEEREEDSLFLMFAHGYEFDYGTKESSWEKFKRICDRVAGNSDIICCSTQTALNEHEKNLRR